MRFKKGDKVMAKWPGTSLYFHATVGEIDAEEGAASVLYEDGTDMEVPIEYLKNEGAFRRKKSKSPARRRSRSRSPARSPGRRQTQKKSAPEMKTPEGGNKSHSTTTSSSSEEKKSTHTPTRTTVSRSARFQKIDVERKEGVEKTTTKNYKAKIVMEKIDGDSFTPSRGTNATVAALKETIANVKEATTTHEYEFGGPSGALFQYIITPLAVIALVSCCEKTDCELFKFKLKEIPQDFRSYFDPVAAMILLGFLLFQAVLYALPLGQTVEGPRTYSGKKTEYRLSAFYSLFFTIMAYSGLMYLRYPVTIVVDKMLPMVATSLVLCFILNILVHIKSYFAEESELNPHANTGSTIYDMFMGRELHPRFGRYYHFKLLVYRPSMNGWVLMNLIYLQKELQASEGMIRPSFAILLAVQIFYCLFVFFWDEGQTMYSFDIKNEGFGFQQLIGNLVIVPFVYTMHARYLLEHPKAPMVPLPMLVSAVVILLLGLVLVLRSSYQKMYFRQNPYDPSLSGLESIPPSKKGGRRLIVSGYWGFVRHPNYLGEILLGLGYGLICGFSDIFPWVYAIFVAGLMVHRSLRDEARCREVHGYSWTEYCRRVPYRIVPYVF